MNDFNVMIPEESMYPGIEQDIEGVQLLVSTIEGTIPGNRYFGMSADILSSNIEDAQNDFLICLIEKMEYFFPNLEVQDVEFQPSVHGDGLHGTIRLMIADGVDAGEEEELGEEEYDE